VKIKLDENLGLQGAATLRRAGHDVATVVDQGMTSATDMSLIAACKAEGRCLVTMDLDFANPMRFDPAAHHGIAVLCTSGPVTSTGIEELANTLVEALEGTTIDGKLWIIEHGRIREYSPETS
jgi:predicted nuclease of predicted toxin-antitoxin system